MDRPTPRADENDRPANIPRRRSVWRPDSRNVKALDRYIAQIYGREWVRRSRG